MNEVGGIEQPHYFSMVTEERGCVWECLYEVFLPLFTGNSDHSFLALPIVGFGAMVINLPQFCRVPKRSKNDRRKMSRVLIN